MTVTALLDGLKPHELIPPSSPEYWAGLRQFAKDTGIKSLIKDADEATQRGTLYDMGIPADRLRAANPEITLAENSRLANNNLAYQLFGADTNADPRAQEILNMQMEISGEAAEACCGTDGGTSSINLKQKITKRGLFKWGKAICWTTKMSAQFAGLPDLVGLYKSLGAKVLDQVDEEVAFYGNEIFNLTGILDLPIERITLDQPLDRLTFNEVYEQMLVLGATSSLTRGDVGVQKTHVVAPHGFRVVRGQLTTNDNTLGSLIDSVTKYRYKYTDRMNFASPDGKPAILMYNRSAQLIKRDVPRGAFMLPPEYRNGELKLQFAQSIGELRTETSDAGLVIQNALTGAS